MKNIRYVSFDKKLRQWRGQFTRNKKTFYVGISNDPKLLSERVKEKINEYEDKHLYY